jgi:diketogulonate reductase-like aldo/keto reductase
LLLLLLFMNEWSYYIVFVENEISDEFWMQNGYRHIDTAAQYGVQEEVC